MKTYIREQSGECYEGSDEFTCEGEAIAHYQKPQSTQSGLDLLFIQHEPGDQWELVVVNGKMIIQPPINGTGESA